MKKLLYILIILLNSVSGFGQDLFGPQQVIVASATSEPTATYATDLDGDGDQDIISASQNDDKIAWYENDGNGNFGVQNIITTTADRASSVYATDLDGDGDQDVISASFGDDKIAWYENDGEGSFEEQNIITIKADGANSVYASDLDGDGDQDIISASLIDDKIAWYENDGEGNFGVQNIITTKADGARAVYATDLDGDGDQDIISASKNDAKIAWYKNLGNGNFGFPNIITTNATNAKSVYASDLDGDGDQDIISGLYDKIAWYENDGNGNFGEQDFFSGPNESVYATDLDGDGDQDIISASGNIVAWHENDGNGNFDFPNIITTNVSRAISVYATDLDGDGDQDVVSASFLDDKIAWYENDGNGNFITTNILSYVFSPARDVYATDLDGDGDMDVLSASSGDNDKIAWYENDGNGNFGVQNIVTTNTDGVNSVYATDLDGDTDQDIISTSYSDGKIAWYENDGNGNFGEQNIISVNTIGARSIYAIDLDEDGDQDVISASEIDDKIAWYENDGSGNFGEQKIITTNADGARSVHATDLDGDGDQDVISASFWDNEIAWYENDGNGNFGEQKIITTNVNFVEALYVIDLDGDGDQDIISASQSPNKIVWYENDGNGNFGEQKIITTETSAVCSLYATDLDEDGDQDILAASRFDNKIAWYENDGNGNFGEQKIITTNADFAKAVYATDLDGDGDQDVLSASSDDNKIAWYENLLNINASLLPITLPTCTGFNNGILQVSISGGEEQLTSPYTYTWSLNDGEEMGAGSSEEPIFLIENLYSGTYDITIVSVSLDTAYVKDYYLTFAPELGIENVNNVGSLIDLPTGSIEFTIEGGNPPYSISWSGAATDSISSDSEEIVLSNLPIGDYNINIMDSNGCQIALGIIVPLIESCSPPNPPTSPEPTLFVCQNEANTDSFNLQFEANTQIAWFETNDINDTIPIALGESYVFEALGTYWASAYTFSETDTCYSERISLEVKEVILLPSFNVPINITEGQSIQLSVSVESNIENSTFSVEWTGIGLDDYTILNPIATPDTTTVYTATFTDQHECTATTTVTVFVEQITTCTAPSSPISFGSIFLCSQAPEPFQIGTNNEIAWFSSNNLNDTIPIAFGEEYIFEEAGTYWAAAFTTFEEDTCYSSSRTPFVLARAFEVENTGGETIQEGESVQISASVINPENGVTYSVQWEGEGLDFYDIENPTASPNVTTEYTATFTDSDGCIAKTFITVFVEGIATCTTPAPPTPIEQTLVVCENELNTQSFSMNVEVGAQIAWFASNNSADISPISFGANAIFQSPDTYYAAAYKVLGTDTCFSNRVLFSIEEMILTATNSGNVTISQGESIEISVSPLESSVLPLLNVTLQWDNEASLDNAMSHNPIASPIETTTYTATFTEIHGCEVTTSLTVTVEPSNDCPNPPPSPIEQNLLTCQGTSNTQPFTVEPVEEGVQVAWFATNDPLDLNFLMVGESVVFPNSGIYYAATFTISANSDICISDRMPFTLEEIILTTNSSEDVEIQQGDNIQLSVSASSTIEGSTFTVQWSGEEGLSNYNIENPIASPTETTTYTATFTDEFGCTVSTSILVTVIPNSPCITLDPPLAFEQRLLVCEGESNTEPFSLQAQGGEQIVWFATDDPLDLIFIATGTDAVFENTGNYYAAAFMIENGKACFSPRILFTIEEITLTTSNSGNTTITAGQSTEIPVFAESNIENNTFSIQWEGEGLDDYTSFNPTASPTETTIYTAIVTDDYGCTDTASLTITVITESDDCQAKITTSNGQFTNCNGGDYSLTVLDESEGENITRYQIDWGDGSINYDESDFPTNGVNHTYSIGIFTLTYTITTANACNSTIEKTIHNDIADPIIGLINTGNTSACGPVELCFEISLFENNHPSTVYEVSFGDSSEPELYNHPPPNPICHPYAASHCETAENGFDFSITARNACSENEAIIPSIVIGTPPTAQFTTNSNTVSIGQSIQLTNTSIEGYDTNCSQETDYLWDFGNNQTSNQESPIQTYNTAGIYQVCLTATNDCSTDEHCQTITVQDPDTTNPTIIDSSLQTRNIAHPNVTGPYGVQVNTYNGNLYFQRTDLVIPNTSLSIDLSFSYNSFRDSLDIGFGKGWTFSYNTYYYEDSTGIVLVRADGRRDFFRKEGNNYTSIEGTFDTWQEYQSNQFMLETKYGMRYYFDDTGHKKLTKIEDTNGNVLQLTYNTNGFPSRITDQSNRFVDLNWTNGHLSSVEDSNEEMRTVNYDYNSDGQLLKVTNPKGGEIQYEYQEGEDALTAIINERNDALDIYYDQNGAVEELVSCLSVLKMRYNRIDYRTYAIEKNPSGNRMITFVFDEDGKFISKKGNCCGYNTQYDYDDGLNVNKMTDANGNVFTVNHDNQGNALLITDPNGDQQSLSFQSNFNRVKSLTDKKGFMTSFNYDVDGNLKDIFQPESIKIQFEYDSKGNIENMKDGNGNYTLMTYNENNDLVEITYPIAGTGESFEYDNRGNMEQSTDGNGNYVKYEYDELSRLIGVQDKLQNEVKLEYDLSSNLTSEIDANGNIKNYAYDALHRLESVETPSGTTNYDYDPSDNLTMITDANQNSTLFQYNTRNLLIEETDALGNTLYYSYDGNGNMMAKTDANGELTTYTYDKLNRLTSKTYKGNTDTYTYDANGNLTHCSNNGISMSFTYDSINRLVAKTVDNWNQTIEYEYDENSNRTKMIDETGETIYTYDINNRLISIKNPKQELTEFEYDLGGRMTKQIQANGVITTYTYDDADRLLKLENKKANGTIVSSYEYVYDGNGNRTQMTEADGTVWEYEYDGDNRLTRASNGTVDENYTFDAVGNRLTLNNQEYNYDEADRIKNADNTNYQFDSNGNLVEKDENGAITTYEYDGENRLISVLTSNGETVKFQYDPFGNRISRTVNGEVTRYLLDSDNVLMELNANNNVTARYTAGLALDSWLSMERNNSSYFYHTDGLGSITVLTNGSENVENTYRYDAYGNINQQTGSITNPYTYTGREWEEAIGLYYYRTRFYDSEVGRFITKDRFKGFMITPNSLNRYIYVENNPIVNVDYNGKFSIKKIFNKLKSFAKKRFLVLAAADKFIRQLETWDEGESWFGTNFCGPAKDGSGNNLKPTSFLDYTCQLHDIAYDKNGAAGASDAFLNFCDEIVEADLKLASGAFVSRFVGEEDTGIGSLAVSSLFMAITAYKRLLNNMPGTRWFTQRNCNEDNGSQEEKNPSSPPSSNEGNPPPSGSNGNSTNIPIIGSVDPNEIIAPKGYGTQKWVAQDATLPYTILFENDPDFATAAAQRVRIDHTFDEDLNASTFRLGDFGFGSHYFTVPEDLTYYNTQINLVDSLGVMLQVTAGVDADNNRAFWELQSRDPETGLTTTLPANVGFLPVNDTISRVGEGFVNFTIRPSKNTITGDTILAKASIIFDDNAPIATNVDFNTIDADAPLTTIEEVEANNGVYELQWSGTDSIAGLMGSGISTYSLYTSTNEGAFLPIANNLTQTSYTYTGSPTDDHCFFVIGRDNVNNQEAIKLNCEPACMNVSIANIVPASGGGANGSIELEVTDNGANLTYQWSHDENLNSPIALDLAAGEYSVVVIDGAGCEIKATFVIDELTDIEDAILVENSLFIHRMYPVPTDTELMIEFSTTSPTVLLEVYDMMGKKLFTQAIKTNSNNQSFQQFKLNTESYPSANYLVRIQSKTSSVSGMFVRR